MKSVLLPIHLSFAGIWLGCVLTETFFERALLGRGRQQELILVELHKRVDVCIEVPAFTVVLVTGALMYSMAIRSVWVYAMMGLGLIAVATNIYCVGLVFQRAAAANQGKWEAFSRIDHKQHQYGAVVLLAIVLALAAGVSIFENA